LVGRTIGKRAGLVVPIPRLRAAIFGDSVPSMSFDTLLLLGSVISSVGTIWSANVAPKVDTLELHACSSVSDLFQNGSSDPTVCDSPIVERSSLATFVRNEQSIGNQAQVARRFHPLGKLARGVPVRFGGAPGYTFIHITS